jgi:hypothetical protein
MRGCFTPVSERRQVRAAAPAHCWMACLGPGANRSLSTIEPVCGTPKWKLENDAQRPASETRPARTEIPEIADQRPGRANLTRGNVADSHTHREIIPRRPDSLADEAVRSEPVCVADSLLTGKITGNFTKIGPFGERLSARTQQNQLVAGQFPTK